MTRLICLLLFLLLAVPSSGQAQEDRLFYFGVDLSYVNEMEDCGAVYHVEGQARDPYEIFADYGANLVRVRLWHNPDWTEYSTLEDVKRSLQRAAELGMSTLLDFHYSDTWADPSKQIIPAAWAHISDPEALADEVYSYTYNTLLELDARGLLPDIVQVGNEINSEMLRAEDAPGYPINWQRNAALLNRAILAVRDVGAVASHAPRVMLHIARPEEVEGWLLAAERAGVADYDIIGLSYYVGWSNHTIQTVAGIVNGLQYRFGKEVIVAETAYPWTLESVRESAGNILGRDFLADGYPATPAGQRQFMTDLTQAVISSGGLGVIYWEPAWVSTGCFTLWGQGSHWENATFFDFRQDNTLHEGIEYLRHDYVYPVEVVLRFVWQGDQPPEQLYFRGSFTGMGRRPLALLPAADGSFALRALLMPGSEISYQFYGALPASEESVLIPAHCTGADGQALLIVPAADVTINHSAGGCP